MTTDRDELARIIHERLGPGGLPYSDALDWSCIDIADVLLPYLRAAQEKAWGEGEAAGREHERSKDMFVRFVAENPHRIEAGESHG